MLKISALCTICFALFSLCSKSQQPVLSVQRFEYVWEPNVENSEKRRVIIPSDDEAKQKIEKSFAHAIQQKWNITVPEIVLSVKPLPVFSFSSSPKFNTKLKDKKQDTWYLFLQIFDRGNHALIYNTDDSLSTTLELKCKLINGSTDSVILDRNLSVKIHKEYVPPDQVVLAGLPAYPAYFIQAFDSVAAWLFQPEYESEKSLWLKPACVFIETKITAEPIKALLFKSDDKNIQQLTEPLFSFQMTDPHYEKINTHRNTGGNIATGAVMLFTGINFNKARVFEYNADFAFEEKDTAYHCIISYAEKETAEREKEKVRDSDGGTSYSINSKSYTLDERRVIPDYSNVITLEKDTLATFGIIYATNANKRDTYTRLWDGTDSATIITLPHEWNNKKEDDNVTITGKIEGNLFSMKTLNEKTIKEFYLSEQLVMIMYGKPYPAKALLFQPLSTQQLKLFTILSSLPYAYFNYSAY